MIPSMELIRLECGRFPCPILDLLTGQTVTVYGLHANRRTILSLSVRRLEYKDRQLQRILKKGYFIMQANVVFPFRWSAAP